MVNSLILEVVPTGGIVKIKMQSADTTGTWTLTRQAQSPNVGTVYTLYSGPPLALPNSFPQWFDDGDQLNQPLSPDVTYLYTFTTASGSVSESVMPACSMVINYDDFTRLLVRVLQAGIQSLAPPTAGAFVKKPVVYVSMPLTGSPPLPCISVNEDNLMQAQTPIGRGINTDTRYNEYQIDEMATRRYRVTVLTSSTDERDFWKTAVISLFKACLIPLLETMGQTVSDRFQAASSQMVEASPGFYFCDISLEFTGPFTVRVLTNYAPFALATDYVTDPNNNPIG